MSKYSQTYFQHEILPQPTCIEPRVSITLRMMKHKPCTRITQTSEFGHRLPPPRNFEGSGYVPYPSYPRQHELEDTNTYPEPRTTGKNVLFVSSSMFRFLNPEGLSSATIRATKLFYPGADASVMLNKLKVDLGSVPTPLSDIYLMTGTNNVNSVYFGSRSLKEAGNDINNLMHYLKSIFPAAVIHIINILPRSSKGRNDVVKELNLLIKEICDNDEHLDFMETSHLFNYKNGQRKQFFFVPPSSKITDNCHLNRTGVQRLAKFLKYWAHQHITNS